MLFGNFSLAELLGIVVALVIGITFHEFSHAFVADQLGDHRPRALGRVSLNPAAHIDPVGAIFFVLAGFGWGRPVPVNTYALRPGRIGMAYVAAAGPIANLVVAALFAVVFRAVRLADFFGPEASFVPLLLASIVFYNVALGLFNLLPIPPLDGYNLVLPFLPPRTAFTVQRYATYGVVALLLLVVLSYGQAPGPLDWLFGGANWITGLLLGA
ncbi:MAG TPA: site-2 protease family protein [Candidatus Dormibacteraeota bacterium]|nr:site-2 protease family protein [Candidatus Dormibacteraeota bacterium]